MEDYYRLIEGFPGYRVSREGEVQSRWLKAGRNSRLTDTWRTLKAIKLGSGHLRHNLSRNSTKYSRRVHRLVLEAFVGPCPPGLVCCHNDGDPANNRVENLRWDTQQSNSDDTLRHGRRAFGSRCKSKLVEEQVVEIRRLWAEGVSANELASRFGICPRHVRVITSGKMWRHVPLFPGSKPASKALPVDQSEARSACCLP